MTYAKARLLLGMTGVGATVLLLSATLALDLPGRLFPEARSLAGEGLRLGVVLGVLALISFPLDLVGGYLLPRKFGRSHSSLGRYLVEWVRGVGVHTICLAGFGVLLLAAGRWGGLPTAFAAFLVTSLALLFAQGAIARLVGGLRRAPEDPSDATSFPGPVETEFWHSDDPTFSGGIVGLPGSEKIVLPERLRRDLPSSSLQAFIRRRSVILEQGLRKRGVFVALAWNSLGFLLAALITGSSLATLPELLRQGLLFTLWSFLGLLLLPTVSRWAVLRGDHEAVQDGTRQEDLETAITRVHEMQDGEAKRPRLIETIFHPIPSLESRLAAFRRRPTSAGAWHAARLSLYLSWTGLGLLSRLVHCNRGKPDVWVLLPAD